MGLFSSKTITTVGTEVQRVIEDEKLPNSTHIGSVKGIIRNDEQLVGHVLEEMVNSVGLRASRMMRYGKEQYIYGTPKATLMTSAAGKDATLAAIQSQYGNVSLDYYHFGAFNNLHIGWLKLVDSYGYDSSTNKLTLNGAAVYLVDMQVVVTNASLLELANGSMDQWGAPANSGPVNGLTRLGISTPFAVDPAAAQDYVLVKTVSSTGVVANFQIPITGFDVNADYHMARFLLNGKAKYWIYKHGSQGNAAIDAVYATSAGAGGDFFPFTYFRYEKTSAAQNKSSRWFTDSAKLLKKIGMDFEPLAETINQNPDIKDVEQAMMVMAVPANTTNALEQRYLFDFFKGIHGQLQTSAPKAVSHSKDYVELNLKLNNEVPSSSVIIQDKRFKMALSWKAIAKRYVAGTIGAPGKYASGYGQTTQARNVNVIGGTPTTWNSSTDVHWYRRQVTESVYEEIQVLDLQMTYWIFENYTTTGDDNGKILLIPIDMEVVKYYSLQDKETLYARALHYVFNSRIVTKLKWYQTGLFKALITAAAVVVAFFTLQPEIYTLAANIAVVLGVSSIVAIVIAVTIYAVDAYLVNKATTYFLKKIDAKTAAALALIAALAGSYQYFSNNSIGWLPSSQELLSTGLNLGNRATTKYLQEQFTSLEEERLAFETDVDAKEKELKSAEALLNTGLNLDPLIIFGETPNEFYQRTVHSGNIGILGVDIVSSYVDIALQLPKTSQTLGDPYGG